MRAGFAKHLWPLLLTVVVACGGGDGSEQSAEVKGTADVAVTSDASTEFPGVWVTVKSVWFNKASVEDIEDRGWIKFPLDQPVTLELTSLAQGNLADVFEGLKLPVGVYHQIRVFLVDNDEALTSSATAEGLSFNAQIDIPTDSGLQPEPLEIVGPNNGVAVRGRFEITEDEPLTLALNFDVDRDVKTFTYEGNTAYILSPFLNYYNLAHVGAVVGMIDTSTLTPAEDVDGAYQVVINAQTQGQDAYRETKRYTTVAADGSFTLFPLFVPEDATSTSYDIVVHGAGVGSMVIENVPVEAGTGPATGQNPTIVQSTALSLTAAEDYRANLSALQPANPTSELLGFYQTADNGITYLMRARALNPFSGLLLNDISLSDGPIQVGEYNMGQPIVFTSAQAGEGDGAYQVLANAPQYVLTPAAEPVEPPLGDSTVMIDLPKLPVEAPATASTFSGTLTQTTAGKYDSGHMIVSRMGYIVTTIPLDDVLTQNGGVGGAFSIDNLPGGSNNDSFDEGVYHVYARVWNSADPEGTVVHRALGGILDLRAGSVTGVDLEID